MVLMALNMFRLRQSGGCYGRVHSSADSSVYLDGILAEVPLQHGLGSKLTFGCECEHGKSAVVAWRIRMNTE